MTPTGLTKDDRALLEIGITMAFVGAALSWIALNRHGPRASLQPPTVLVDAVARPCGCQEGT